MAIRKFPDIRTMDWKSTKSEKWNTEVQKSGSGMVRTMTTWLYPQWTIETSFAYLTDDQYRMLLGFVALIKGAHEPFLWLDPEDYEEKGVQIPRDNAGRYQAVMRMSAYTEPVSYIEDVTVYVDGAKIESTKYTVTNGTISFDAPPGADAVVTADYTYWWKVQLDDDGLGIEKVFKDINKSKTMKMVTVR